MNAFDRIVLLGFGGPESRDEIRPFLARVLKGRNVPPERVELVASHYEHIGARSPFNDWTRRQAAALHDRLVGSGITAPVEPAYLYAEPYAADLAAHISDDERVLAIVLASFQSPASWDRYLILPRAAYAAPIGTHPLFVKAYADRAREALRDFSNGARPHVIFTAHSIPEQMAAASPYAEQFETAARNVAREAGAHSWQSAYQSRSGTPSEPWLGPDVREVVAGLPARGIRDALIVPIGFLCDHVEVLYDLDVDAAGVARDAGVRLRRARALNDHPQFIELLADLVQQCAALPS